MTTVPALASASPANTARTPALESASPANTASVLASNIKSPALASACPAGDTTHTTRAPTPHAGGPYYQPQGIPQSEIPQDDIAVTPHPSQDETPQGIPQDETPPSIPQDEIPQDNLAEVHHPSQDDAPVLDFETGTKRERRIDSSDAGSEQEVPTQDEESHSEHESPPLLTFGAAPTLTQRTLAASTKAINRRTANDLAGVPSGKVSACPVANCNASITESWSFQQFYKHMEEGTHTAHFYHARSHRCPFGCHEGFLMTLLYTATFRSSCASRQMHSSRISRCANSATIDPEGLLISLVH